MKQHNQDTVSQLKAKVTSNLIAVHTAAEVPTSEVIRFKKVLLELSNKLTGSSYEKAMRTLEGKLDSPLVAFIERTCVSKKFDHARLTDALVQGQRSEGTEPSAAIDGATAFITKILRGLSR